MKKIAARPYLVMFILIFLFMFILEHVFGMQSSALRAGIAAAFGVLFSPRTKMIKTQSGKVKQITWMFLKEPITIHK